MARIIDADNTVRTICGYYCGCERDECGSGEPCEAVAFIDDAPTVSPDEVRGAGKWVDKGVRAWSCSCCGTPINHIRQFASFEKNELPNYCPSCGARMGGVQDALS